MLPADYVINSTLKVGIVYKFKAPELITTTVPHYFIVVGIEDETNYLCLCTTQLQKKLNHISHTGHDPNTIAYISPNNNNGLTSDTYINCNDYFTISKEELVNKVSNGGFSISGTLSKSEYEVITTSIDLSYVNDIPKHLLKFE